MGEGKRGGDMIEKDKGGRGRMCTYERIVKGNME
jgi:hypothetical protein